MSASSNNSKKTTTNDTNSQIQMTAELISSILTPPAVKQVKSTSELNLLKLKQNQKISEMKQLEESKAALIDSFSRRTNSNSDAETMFLNRIKIMEDEIDTLKNSIDIIRMEIHLPDCIDESFSIATPQVLLSFRDFELNYLRGDISIQCGAGSGDFWASGSTKSATGTAVKADSSTSANSELNQDTSSLPSVIFHSPAIELSAKISDLFLHGDYIPSNLGKIGEVSLTTEVYMHFPFEFRSLIPPTQESNTKNPRLAAPIPSTLPKDLASTPTTTSNSSQASTNSPKRFTANHLLGYSWEPNLKSLTIEIRKLECKTSIPIPDSLIRKILNVVLPSVLKKKLGNALPPEFGLLLSLHQDCHFTVRASLNITGIEKNLSRKDLFDPKVEKLNKAVPSEEPSRSNLMDSESEEEEQHTDHNNPSRRLGTTPIFPSPMLLRGNASSNEAKKSEFSLSQQAMVKKQTKLHELSLHRMLHTPQLSPPAADGRIKRTNPMNPAHLLGLTSLQAEALMGMQKSFLRQTSQSFTSLADLCSIVHRLNPHSVSRAGPAMLASVQRSRAGDVPASGSSLSVREKDIPSADRWNELVLGLQKFLDLYLKLRARMELGDSTSEEKKAEVEKRRIASFFSFEELFRAVDVINGKPLHVRVTVSTCSFILPLEGLQGAEKVAKLRNLAKMERIIRNQLSLNHKGQENHGDNEKEKSKSLPHGSNSKPTPRKNSLRTSFSDNVSVKSDETSQRSISAEQQNSLDALQDWAQIPLQAASSTVGASKVRRLSNFMSAPLRAARASISGSPHSCKEGSVERSKVSVETSSRKSFLQTGKRMIMRTSSFVNVSSSSQSTSVPPISPSQSAASPRSDSPGNSTIPRKSFLKRLKPSMSLRSPLKHRDSAEVSQSAQLESGEAAPRSTSGEGIDAIFDENTELDIAIESALDEYMTNLSISSSVPGISDSRSNAVSTENTSEASIDSFAPEVQGIGVRAASAPSAISNFVQLTTSSTSSVSTDLNPNETKSPVQVVHEGLASKSTVSQQSTLARIRRRKDRVLSMSQQFGERVAMVHRVLSTAQCSVVCEVDGVKSIGGTASNIFADSPLGVNLPMEYSNVSATPGNMVTVFGTERFIGPVRLNASHSLLSSNSIHRVDLEDVTNLIFAIPRFLMDPVHSAAKAYSIMDRVIKSNDVYPNVALVSMEQFDTSKSTKNIRGSIYSPSPMLNRSTSLPSEHSRNNVMMPVRVSSLNSGPSNVTTMNQVSLDHPSLKSFIYRPVPQTEDFFCELGRLQLTKARFALQIDEEAFLKKLDSLKSSLSLSNGSPSKHVPSQSTGASLSVDVGNRLVALETVIVPSRLKYSPYNSTDSNLSSVVSSGDVGEENPENGPAYCMRTILAPWARLAVHADKMHGRVDPLSMLTHVPWIARFAMDKLLPLNASSCVSRGEGGSPSEKCLEQVYTGHNFSPSRARGAIATAGFLNTHLLNPAANLNVQIALDASYRAVPLDFSGLSSEFQNIYAEAMKNPKEPLIHCVNRLGMDPKIADICGLDCVLGLEDQCNLLEDRKLRRMKGLVVAQASKRIGSDTNVLDFTIDLRVIPLLLDLGALATLFSEIINE